MERKINPSAFPGRNPGVALGREARQKRQYIRPPNEKTEFDAAEVLYPSLEKRGYSFNNVCRDQGFFSHLSSPLITG